MHKGEGLEAISDRKTKVVLFIHHHSLCQRSLPLLGDSITIAIVIIFVIAIAIAIILIVVIITIIIIITPLPRYHTANVIRGHQDIWHAV
jgi:hypothetical protein